MSILVVAFHTLAAGIRVRAMQRSLPFDDRGEGVISTAIAVLILAFLGAAMWLGFSAIWADAEDNIGEQVDQIGR